MWLREVVEGAEVVWSGERVMGLGNLCERVQRSWFGRCVVELVKLMKVARSARGHLCGWVIDCSVTEQR
jgi:hypothetical protein